MTIEMKTDSNGRVCGGEFSLYTDEAVALDRCHEIIKARLEAVGRPYSDAQKERCEWWLLGILRIEGMTEMVNKAKFAHFSAASSIELADA